MKEGKKINSLWITVLLSLVIVVFTASMLRITAHAEESNVIGSRTVTLNDMDITYNYASSFDYTYVVGSTNYYFEMMSDIPVYWIVTRDSSNSVTFKIYSYEPATITRQRVNTSGTVVEGPWTFELNLTDYGYYYYNLGTSCTACDLIETPYSSTAVGGAFSPYFASEEFEEIKELPDLSKFTLNDEYRLTGFTANNAINASWTGSTASDCGYVDKYNIIEFMYEPKATYDYVNPIIFIVYEDTIDISLGSFFISWINAQIDNTDYYLSCMKVTPIGQDSSGLLYKGKSSIALYDAFGSFLGATTPTTVDTESLTDNIAGAVYDSSIPTLSNLTRTNNGYSDVMSSYSQSVTFRWSDYFEDSSYYIQVRTTFRYKLAMDSIWEEVTLDTSVPMGRYSCLVDEQVFTYTYGDYANLFWQQDNNIFTADDLDKQGNIQPIKDSIRIVKFTDGVATCGSWTTFTLKNGIWETGSVTGSYVSESLDENNNSSAIPDDEAGTGNFLVDFDFTNVSGAWDAFTGMFRNLISFLGEFPALFAEVFSFLPYEIRNMIYISMISICVIGLCKAVIH